MKGPKPGSVVGTSGGCGSKVQKRFKEGSKKVSKKVQRRFKEVSKKVQRRFKESSKKVQRRFKGSKPGSATQSRAVLAADVDAQPEVHDFRVPVVVENDILRFQVTMQNALVVVVVVYRRGGGGRGGARVRVRV